MIDAYEIGIQLLMQDDVSAGLDVISRELAQVDKAIEATNAGLVALVQNAAKTSVAVASSVGRGSSGVGRATEQAYTPPSEINVPAAPADPQALAPNRPAEPKADRAPEAVLPVEREITAGSAAPVEAPRARTSLESRPDATARQSDAPLPPAAAKSTAPPTLDLTPRVSEPSAAPVTEQAPAAPAGRGRAEPSIIIEHNIPEIMARVAAAPAATAMPGERQATVRPTERPSTTMTSSIQRASAPVTPKTEASLPRQAAAFPPFVEGQSRQKVTAPWMGASVRNTDAASIGPVERAAAPAAAAAGRGEGGGGSVMLDGRLVGQWLSEHMARDAARPPGGTSFFDARQTPGWNISGAF